MNYCAKSSHTAYVIYSKTADQFVDIDRDSGGYAVLWPELRFAHMFRERYEAEEYMNKHCKGNSRFKDFDFEVVLVGKIG